jgi:tetratricopeptide (TPR) repeat protein
MHIDGKSSIIEAFADLPPDIRRLLGPRLTSVFLDRGLESSARLVSDILERAPGDHGVEHDLIVGNLLLIEGGMPEAEEAYRSLTEDNSEMATEALVELATFKLKQDGLPPEHLLMDLGAAAKILRGTQNGGELRRLEALWLAKLGREAEAIDMLIAEIETDPANAEIFHKTAEDILSALSLSSKLENNYAEIVSSYIEFTPKSADADWLRTEIAQKLLLSGMPNYAIVVLKPSLQRSKPDAISLAAEANILANRPDVALTLLKDATGDAARMLRVEAHLRAENFAEALRQLDQLTDRSSEIVSPHWFNGDWASVARSNSAAAKIRERYLVGGSGGGSGAYNFSEFMIGQGEADPITLSSIQELLVYSQSVSHELGAVLLQQ